VLEVSSSSCSDSPSGPSGISELPAAAFFTSNVLDGWTAPRADSTGLALAGTEDDFCIAAFSTSALYIATEKSNVNSSNTYY